MPHVTAASSCRFPSPSGRGPTQVLLRGVRGGCGIANARVNNRETCALILQIHRAGEVWRRAARDCRTLAAFWLELPRNAAAGTAGLCAGWSAGGRCRSLRQHRHRRIAEDLLGVAEVNVEAAAFCVGPLLRLQ